MDIGAAVTRKVGPLPVYAYGLIIAGVIWIYYIWQGKNAGADSGSAMPSSDAADSGIGLGDDTGDTANTGGSGTGSTSGVSTPTDNLSWFTMASNYLVGFNYDSVSVSNALSKYLTGEQLTTAERALVNQAVARFGVPPEGVPVSPGATPTTPTYPPTRTPPTSDRPGTPYPRRSPPPYLGGDTSLPTRTRLPSTTTEPIDYHRGQRYPQTGV